MGESKQQGEYVQIEDRAMKIAAMYFGQEILKALEIKGKIQGVASTEQIQMDVRGMSEDFNFVMEDGSWLHLEFESDCVTEKDLRRFRAYDAYIEMAHEVVVRTIVLCTASTRIESRRLVRDNGIYEVKIICLKKRDGDRLIEKVLSRQRRGKTLRKKDISPLLMTPLMSGRKSEAERIYQVMDLIRGDTTKLSKAERRRMEAILYAWAVKLLSNEELERLKERWKMTVLGQMLVDAGIEQGDYLRLIRQVIKKRNLGQSEAKIAEDLLEKPEEIAKICRVAKSYPDDVQKIYTVLTKDKKQ